MKKKSIKIFISAVVVIGIVLGVTLPILASKGMLSKGNNENYSVKNTKALGEYKNLNGKRILFLGSSVTYGSAAKGESFADYLAVRDGVFAIKEAVSGTTLVDNGDSSYIQRLNNVSKDLKVDMVICQLSTNDATKKKPLGEIAKTKNIEDFDTQTVAGAIEYVIAYSKETFNCPVVFYTGTKYDSEQYGKMVDLLLDIADKWDIGVIDLWNNEMNNISKAQYKLYMANGIHPTRAGYRDWWTPQFEKFLNEYFEEK